jgi:hypothetical protein
MPYMTYEPATFRGANEALVQRAEDICQEYGARGFSMTLRQLYYQMVARDVIPNNLRSYKNLGNLVSRARRAGRINWFSIVDRGRTIHGYSSWNTPADIINSAAEGFQLPLWATTFQAYRPQVWVEKDALSDVVARACARFRVPYLACKGYPSDSVLWEGAQNMIRQSRTGHIPVVLHLGDHDPSGLDMTRDLQDRLTLFGADVEVQRIALTMDQIDQYNPPPNPAKTTDARFEGYMAEYGDESWELDALPPDVLAGVIESNLAPYVDVDAWEQGEAEEENERERLRVIVRNWDSVRDYADTLE